MSIMNMPPLSYLKRMLGALAEVTRGAYVNADLWDAFDPTQMTLCSPDAQAFRPTAESVNTLQVRLPTNFKAARFDHPDWASRLEDLAHDIDAYRFFEDGQSFDVPVKLRVYESGFRTDGEVADADYGELSLRFRPIGLLHKGCGARRSSRVRADL